MIIVPIINKINQNNNHNKLNNEGFCCVPCMGICHPLCFLLEEQTIQVHGDGMAMAMMMVFRLGVGLSDCQLRNNNWRLFCVLCYEVCTLQ